MSIDYENYSKQKANLSDSFNELQPTALHRESEYVGLGSVLLRKSETNNYTKAFKWRGARNAAEIHIKNNPDCQELVTASAGNHAQGVALAAQSLGRRAIVFVPKNTPKSKIDGILSFGAVLNAQAETYEEAEQLAMDHSSNNSYSYFIHAFDNLDVIRGNGTIGDELLLQLADLQNVSVLVPVGGGGILAGVSRQIKLKRPDIEVIGVTVEGSDSSNLTFRESLKDLFTYQSSDGSSYAFKTDRSAVSDLTICTASNLNNYVDGVKVVKPGVNAAELFTKYADGFISVPNDKIGELIAVEQNNNYDLSLQLPNVDWNEYSAEPAGLLAKAGALALASNFARPNRTYVYISTGANYDLSTMQSLADIYYQKSNKKKDTVLKMGINCVSASFEKPQI